MDNREKIEEILIKDVKKKKKEQDKGCDLCNCYGCYGCNIDVGHLFSICCICFYIQ
uniref:Uncharacterized protein n=1 Tax=viral metagenome TaxID=1070528 RepID=A0A6C0ARN4_9ZZZZ